MTPARQAAIAAAIVSRLPRPEPTPSDATIMSVLDVLERAGGQASLFPDGSLRHGDSRIECPVGVVSAATQRGLVEHRFGNTVRLTANGHRAAIANRWRSE